MNMTLLEDLQSTYSDYHKSLYGFRPGPSQEVWNDVAALEALIKDLDDDAPRVQAEEDAREQAAITKFEDVVKDTIRSGAKDRATAIKWLKDAYEDVYVDNDEQYFEYLNGLPYGYLKENQ